MSKRRKPVGEGGAERAGRSARRTLPYSDTPTDRGSQPRFSSDGPADGTSQPRLKQASDIRTRVTPLDRPRITPVSQPEATFAYRPTEPEMEKVPAPGDAPEDAPEDASKDAPEDAPESEPSPSEPSAPDAPTSSPHLRAAASRRPRDLPPLVKDTNYRYVANRPRKDQQDD